MSACMLGICLVASGCSSSGEWPDLAAPLSGIEANDKPEGATISALPAPSVAGSDADPFPESEVDRNRLVRSTLDRFNAAASDVERQISEISYAQPDERMIAWNGAQISLTRLAKITDAINDLVNLDHIGALGADRHMMQQLKGLRVALDAAHP